MVLPDGPEPLLGKKNPSAGLVFSRQQKDGSIWPMKLPRWVGKTC